MEGIESWFCPRNLAIAFPYRVVLPEEQRFDPHDHLATRTALARAHAHARIGPKADQGDGGAARPNARIAGALETSPSAVARVRRRWAEHGPGGALHDTPKHGSWLGVVEIELSAPERQCLYRRIADRPTLAAEVAGYFAARKAARESADRHVSTAGARIRLRHLYPVLIPIT